MKSLYESIFDDDDERAERITRQSNCPEYLILNSRIARKGDPNRKELEYAIQEINNDMINKYGLDTKGYIYTEGTGGVISDKRQLIALIVIPCSDSDRYKAYVDRNGIILYNFDCTPSSHKLVKSLGFKSIVAWRKWVDDYVNHFKEMGIKATKISNLPVKRYIVIKLE